MILFPVFLGVILGTVAGIVPGMHVNTLIPFLFLVFSNMDVTELAVLIVSTAMSEIFMNIIPSTFLGAPDTETALSVLPAHRLLFSGKGYEAVVITILSSLFSLLLTVLLVFLFYPFFVPLYTVTRPYLHFLLLTVIFFMIYSEKNFPSSIKALVVISLSGLFGTIVLNSKISTSNVLFPVLTGMFGMSGLLFSVSQNSTLPEQDYRIRTEINTFEFVKSVFLGSLAGIAIGFLPAIGISEAATMVRYLTKLDGERGFLATLGGINMGNEVFSLISLYLVGNPRSGASVAIGSLLPFLDLGTLILILSSIFLSSSLSSLLSLYLGRKIPKLLLSLNYKIVNLAVIVFLLSLTFLTTGFTGILILLTSTSLGVLCLSLGVRRSHCMGVLLIPSLFFFSGLTPSIISFLGL